jgi:hypothetical protein
MGTKSRVEGEALQAWEGGGLEPKEKGRAFFAAKPEGSKFPANLYVYVCVYLDGGASLYLDSRFL